MCHELLYGPNKDIIVFDDITETRATVQGTSLRDCRSPPCCEEEKKKRVYTDLKGVWLFIEDEERDREYGGHLALDTFSRNVARRTIAPLSCKQFPRSFPRCLSYLCRLTTEVGEANQGPHKARACTQDYGSEHNLQVLLRFEKIGSTNNKKSTNRNVERQEYRSPHFATIQLARAKTAAPHREENGNFCHSRPQNLSAVAGWLSQPPRSRR